MADHLFSPHDEELPAAIDAPPGASAEPTDTDWARAASGDPLWPPPPPAPLGQFEPAPKRPRRPILRAAIAGGVAGALLAAVTSFGVVELTDHDATPKTTTVAAATPLATSAFDVQGVLAKVGDAVVSIDVTAAGRFGQTVSGAGSGFVISDQGYVLTNNHVVDGASTVTVTFSDGTTESATVVGTDAAHDIAVLKIADVHGATPLALADTSTLEVGDEVLAIGNALDLGDSPTVTLGIVSAKDRTIQTDTETLQGLLQTDAAINPGNSGGPLVDAAGQVVGINTAGIEGANNIGFAIDINTVKTTITQLEQSAGT
jgi:S1-C subfamily serine protease